ncbi:MAG: tetratricopeptide repeat protein, partial [Desulfatirhabdiaceae bacterium]
SSLIFGILAFLCKQNAASLPAAIALIEYACYDRTWQGWKRKLKWIIPGFMLIGFFYLFNMGLFRHQIQIGSFLEDVSSAARDTGYISRWHYLCTQFNVIPIYMRLLVIPIHQNLDYLYPIKRGFFDGATPYGFLFLCIILYTGWRSRAKYPIVFVGVMWFFITLSVESSIFPIRDALFEHRLYLPLFGFILILAFLCDRILSNYGSWIYGVAGVIVLTLSAATYSRNHVWENDVSLWSNVVQRNPMNFRGFSSLGTALENRGDLKAALAQYDTAIRLKPDYYIALYNKGVLLARMNRPEEAIALFYQTLKVKPNYSKAMINLGVALVRKGRVDEGVGFLQQALAIQPLSLQANLNLATIFVNTGKPQEAIGHYLQALRVEPGSPDIHNRAGRIYHVLSRYNEAIHHYQEAIRLDPKNPEAYLNLGNAQMSLNLMDDAISSYRESVRLKPDLIEGYINWGVVCQKKKNMDEAIKLFRTALKINPDLVEAHANLGNALYLKGNMAEAMQSFGTALRLKPDSREIRDNINRIIRSRPMPGSNPD